MTVEQEGSISATRIDIYDALLLNEGSNETEEQRQSPQQQQVPYELETPIFASSQSWEGLGTEPTSQHHPGDTSQSRNVPLCAYIFAFALICLMGWLSPLLGSHDLPYQDVQTELGLLLLLFVLLLVGVRFIKFM